MHRHNIVTSVLGLKGSLIHYVENHHSNLEAHPWLQEMEYKYPTHLPDHYTVYLFLPRDRSTHETYSIAKPMQCHA